MKNILTCLALICTINIASAQQINNLLIDLGSYPTQRSGWSYEMQSSYDRGGGNDDGFNGTYSVIRHEGDKAVIAESEGAGFISRIWFPYNAGSPIGPMTILHGKIYVYLDGNDTPSLELPAMELFNNTNPLFAYPLCGMVMGGCYMHLPIPYNNGAKIMVDGNAAGFVQVQFTTLDKTAERFETFDYQNNSFRDNRAQMMSQYWNLGFEKELKIEDGKTLTKELHIQKGNNQIAYIKGAKTIRSLVVKGDPLEIHKFMTSTLEIWWDGKKAISLPMDMFFLFEPTGVKGRSLLAGQLPLGDGVYNYMPMPFNETAEIRVNSTQECTIEVSITQTEGAQGGWLYATYRQEPQTTPGNRYLWLDVEGEGHYLGLYMRSAGWSYHDSNHGGYWTGCLEGDEVFEVDGQMVSHGTGTEDYFNVGWNGMPLRLDHAQMLPFHGYTLYDCSESISRTAAYRWHLPTEVIPFRKSIRASIEVGPTDDNVGSYESAAYYYLY